MEEGRLLSSSPRKPRLVLTNADYAFLRDLKVGDKGQIGCVLEVESIAMEMDGNGNEMKMMRLSLKNIDLIQNKMARVY